MPNLTVVESIQDVDIDPETTRVFRWIGVIILTISTIKPQSPFYEQLLGKVDEQLLHLRDAREYFCLDKV